MLKGPNQSQFLPSEVNVVFKIMSMEQLLFAKVVMIRQKYVDNKKEKENTKKYNFQGKSARSIRWFDPDREWLEENFRTLSQISIETLSNKYYGSRDENRSFVCGTNWQCRNNRKIEFRLEAPVIKYRQKSSHGCYLISLASAFQSIGDNRSATALFDCII